MINGIVITAFQSLDAVVLEPGGWTAIVGESDVGKSAIVRALYAALTNQRGDYFIRQGMQATSIVIDVDGHTVGWTKRRGRVGSYDVDGELATPEQVRALLPVALEVDGDEMFPGFQRQHDAPFLFADTPRRRAQILGAFDGTNLLLAADGAVRRRQREAQATATTRRAEAAAAQQEADDLAWVESAALAAEAARAALEQHSRLTERVEAQNRLLEGLESLAAQIAAIDSQMAAIGDLDAIAMPLERAAGSLLRAALIEDMASQAGAVTRQLAALGRYQQPDLDAYLPRLERVAAGAALLAETAALETSRGELEREDVRVTEALTAATAELFALAGTPCPVCGAPIEAEALA